MNYYQKRDISPTIDPYKPDALHAFPADAEVVEVAADPANTVDLLVSFDYPANPGIATGVGVPVVTYRILQPGERAEFRARRRHVAVWADPAGGGTASAVVEVAAYA